MASDLIDPNPSKLIHGIRWSGMLLGPVCAAAVYALTGDSGLSEPGRRVLGVAVVMAVWWLSEAAPVSVTALLPLVLLPLLRVGTMKETAAPYADEIMFLFVGGFVIGEALQQSGLHRRFALWTLLVVGTTPKRVVAGVMLATAFISMWVSNTATTIMMLPIGMSILGLVERGLSMETPEGAAGGGKGWSAADVRHFGIALVLGIAYAASIGGVATPVGSPPNVIMLRYAREVLGLDVSFLEWMAYGVPIMLALLPIAWVLLVKVFHPVHAKTIPGGRDLLKRELREVGAWTAAQRVTLAVFIAAAALWIGREALGDYLDLKRHFIDPVTGVKTRPSIHLLTDAGIAMGAALVLFLTPIDFKKRKFVVRHEQVEQLPWGILLLFGGGLSIADAMSRTGVDVFLGSQFGALGGLPLIVMLVILVAAVVLGGELASNAAMVTAMMPVIAPAAKSLGLDPLPLMMAVTFAASCGFMLPVATPPNALAYATRRVSQGQMIRAGFALDVAGIAVVCGVMYLAAVIAR